MQTHRAFSMPKTEYQGAVADHAITPSFYAAVAQQQEPGGTIRPHGARVQIPPAAPSPTDPRAEQKTDLEKTGLNRDTKCFEGGNTHEEGRFHRAGHFRGVGREGRVRKRFV